VTRLEGVYWDLDGTIANTELEAHLPAFNNAFNDLGIDWNWDTNTYIKLLKINGGKNRIAYYAKSNNDNFSEDLILKIHETKQFHYLEIIKKNCVSLKTGVFRLINELHKKKVRQFIVTSSSRNQVNLLVEYLPVPGFSTVSFNFCLICFGVGISGFPIPKSIMSFPLDLSLALRLFTSAKTYGGNLLILSNSFRIIFFN